MLQNLILIRTFIENHTSKMKAMKTIMKSPTSWTLHHTWHDQGESLATLDDSNHDCDHIND
jgi:hypothetical protein